MALKESADAFPPLKGAVGGAIALCDIAERAKHSKSDARAIALRVKEIMDVVADAVPDGSAISPPMLLSIQRFSDLMDEIRSSMEVITLTSGVSRVMHLNRNEHLLQGIKTRLDDAYRDLLAASTLRLEVQQTQLAMQQAQFAIQQAHLQLDLKNVSSVTTRLLLYAQITGFFGRPLMLLYKLRGYPFRHDTLSTYARGPASRGIHPAYSLSL